jgi:hypothetical protein
MQGRGLSLTELAFPLLSERVGVGVGITGGLSQPLATSSRCSSITIIIISGENSRYWRPFYVYALMRRPHNHDCRVRGDEGDQKLASNTQTSRLPAQHMAFQAGFPVALPQPRANQPFSWTVT